MDADSRFCQGDLREGLFKCPRCGITTDESVDLNQAIRDRDISDIAVAARSVRKMLVFFTVVLVLEVLRTIFVLIDASAR